MLYALPSHLMDHKRLNGLIEVEKNTLLASLNGFLTALLAKQCLHVGIDTLVSGPNRLSLASLFILSCQYGLI